MKTIYVRFLLLAIGATPVFGQAGEIPAPGPVALAAPKAGDPIEVTLAYLQQTDPALQAALENITIVSMENLNRSDEAQIAAEVLVLDRIEALQPGSRDLVSQKRAEVEKRRQEMEVRKTAVKALKEKRSS